MNILSKAFWVLTQIQDGGVDGGIEIPLDINKQPLIWVDSEVNEDGSILVKTYHRTHPNAPEFARNDIDGFNDGDPIDIPDGRFYLCSCTDARAINL